MKPQHWAMVLLVLFGASVAAVRVLVENGPRQPLNAEQLADHKRPLEPLWAAPDFSYMSQRSQTVTKASLLGKPWVANFIFTQCRTVCPLLTAKMVQLQHKLKGVDVRFISFSVDPEHDTPEVLEQYAMHWSPDEQRWSLLATDAASLAKLTTAFRVTAQKNTDARAVDPIIHSSVFVLVDAQGQVRGVYDSERRDSFQSLSQDVLKLSTPKAPEAARAPRDGQTLYRELSCGACHDRPELAPPLGGLIGKNRELDNASVVVADEAYLRESILEPEAKRVRPYALKMPAYDALIAEPELTTLVKYLAALPANARATADLHEGDDPVCHMHITVAPDSPAADFEGQTFHFCSLACRERFVKAPQGFVVNKQ